MKFFQRLSLAFLVLLVDYASKALVNFYIQPIQYASTLFPFGGIAIFQDFLGVDFCIDHVTNRGAAWGMFSGFQEILLISRILIVIGVIAYLIVSPKAKPFLVPLILVVTGALGNILDYFIYGHVVDMFHFILWGYTYPVFNVADAAIFLGVVSTLWRSRKFKKQDHVASEG
jgi:signal peptidase II